MHQRNRSLAHTIRMLPRLAVMSFMIGVPVLALGTTGASSNSAYSDRFVVGSDLSSPNGCGFVLAVGLQRTQ